jgi:hypothetical protein
VNPADEMVAKMGSTERHSSGAVAEPDDFRQLRATLKNLGSGGKLNEQRENLLRPNPGRKPMEDLRGLVSEIDRRLDNETSDRKKIDDRLRAIDSETKRLDNQTKPRALGAFARYLVAILIGVAVALAWESYGAATKQVIATNAPELGWSPEAKQMIAGWMQQFGWTNSEETPRAAPDVEAAVAPKAPAAPSIDPEQMQQLMRSLTTLRQSVDQLAGSQDQMAREIERLQKADVEILAKITSPPPPRPIAAPAHKPPPGAQSSRTPMAPPSSRAAIPPRQ